MTTRPTETAQPNPAELARAHVAELNNEELAFARMFREKARELEAVQDAQADQLRAATDKAAAAHDSAQRVSVLANELEQFAKASKRSRELRLAAMPAVFKAEAGELDRQAAQLDTDAAANKAAVDEKRRELEAIADCPYVPQPARPPDRAVGAGQSGVGSIAVFNVPSPLFKRLQSRAEALRLEAAQRRVKEPHKAGSIDADNLEHLIEAVFSDPMRVGPSVDNIAQRFPGTASGRLHLEWVNGLIVKTSFVSSQSSAPAAAIEATTRAPETRAPQNVIFSSTAEQAIDTEAEFARAAATQEPA
jgi:hypothetical protein